MSSGFNTDVRVGEQVFHVQTEDRGPSRPVIDTVVYQNGRVLHRRSSNYEQFAAAPEFTAEALRQRVETQHRAVIDDVRSGAIESKPLAPEPARTAEQARQDETASPPSAGTPADEPSAIEVQLLNPGSWLSAGKVSLDLEIVRRDGRQPCPGARVEAFIDGALNSDPSAAMADDQGRVEIRFPLPPLGKGDLALVIRATAHAGKAELRFPMRSREKKTPEGPAQ